MTPEPTKPSTCESISAECDTLVAHAREFVLAQKDLWQKVPMLALKAATGYNDGPCIVDAWKRGYWKVFLPRNPHYAPVHIDLATGELCCGSGSGEKASASDILSVLPHNVEQNLLSAENVLAYLRKAGSVNHPVNPAENETVGVWRARMIRESKLTEAFVRST